MQCKPRNPKTNSCKLIIWQTLCSFFLEHPVNVVLCFVIVIAVVLVAVADEPYNALTNNYAKYYCDLIILVQVIIKD